MDTVYYTMKTRKVKVSGGADLLTFVPADAAAPARAGAGEVLDFDRCRRKLETRAAWRALARAAEETRDPEEERGGEPAGPPPDRPAARLGGRLELAATAAVALAGVCASLAFLSLL